MTQKGPTGNKEIIVLIQHFEKIREEGKIPYLEVEQYEEIIEYYAFLKNYAKATEVVKMALQIHPGNTRLIAARIALYIDEGRLEEAHQTINIALEGNSYPVRLIYAELLAAEGKIEEARKILDSFDDDETDEIDCLEIGVLSTDLEFYDKALDWLNKCLTFNPENEDAINSICYCYQNMGQFDKTIDLYNKLIDKCPYSADYWSGLGKSYFYMAQFDKAIEACDFALVGDENDWEAYNFKGHSYYQLENFKEAIKAYKEAWRLVNNEDEVIPMFIAFSYIAEEDWGNAYTYTKKAIALTDEDAPMFPDLMVNLARCLFYLDKIEEACNTLEHVMERFPNNVPAYVYAGTYCMKEGNREQAITLFNRAVEISPTADTWNQICIAAINSEEFELAKYALECVKEIDPEFEDLNENMALISSQLAEGQSITLNRKKFKEYIRGAVSSGLGRPEAYDIDHIIQQAREEGKSEEEIEDIVEALEQLNKLLENFDIDEEDDETDDSEIRIE